MPSKVALDKHCSFCGADLSVEFRDVEGDVPKNITDQVEKAWDQTHKTMCGNGGSTADIERSTSVQGG